MFRYLLEHGGWIDKETLQKEGIKDPRQTLKDIGKKFIGAKEDFDLLFISKTLKKKERFRVVR